MCPAPVKAPAEKAFSLVEIVLAISVLAVLASLAASAFSGIKGSAKNQKLFGDANTINYQRESSNLLQLSIDGRVWDLRKGAVFQVNADGSVMQHSVYPPLIREENVAEWLKEIGLPELRAESSAPDEVAEKEPEPVKR